MKLLRHPQEVFDDSSILLDGRVAEGDAICISYGAPLPIIRRINAVDSAELQTILELRYLSYMRWEEIAIELGYGIDNVFRLHRNALDEITIPETIQ